MEKSYNYLIGKSLLVEKAPNVWTSLLGGKCPLDLEFPRLVKLKEVEQFDFIVAGLCEHGYSWDVLALLEVSDIVENNCVVTHKNSKKGKYFLWSNSVYKVEEVKTFSGTTMLRANGA